MRIRYSPDSRDRLKTLKKEIGKKFTDGIINGINSLADNPKKCPSVENILGIPSPYYFLHIQHHYVFYRIDSDIIYVTDIYNEREDFLEKMFGIKLRTQESIDYWGE
jgi:mRNA-degrading endonuclease RelE of RelBE toxin-antitoxin system